MKEMRHNDPGRLKHSSQSARFSAMRCPHCRASFINRLSLAHHFVQHEPCWEIARKSPWRIIDAHRVVIRNTLHVMQSVTGARWLVRGVSPILGDLIVVESCKTERRARARLDELSNSAQLP